ncbi:MAG: hypothetical protein R6U68_07740 [Desulfobacteraceae bacterium]
MRENNKGSLNLSIQAIVVLVMAMAVLGLGLGFIRGLIGQGQGQFEEAIDMADLINKPSADDSFLIDANIVLKSNKETQFNAGVYNDGTFKENHMIKVEVDECSPDLETDVRSVTQQIPIGEGTGYKSTMKVENAESGVYVCQFKAQAYRPIVNETGYLWKDTAGHILYLADETIDNIYASGSGNTRTVNEDNFKEDEDEDGFIIEGDAYYRLIQGEIYRMTDDVKYLQTEITVNT